ncbi:MAG: glycogen/starch synthase, partial [Comamonas sp.]
MASSTPRKKVAAQPAPRATPLVRPSAAPADLAGPAPVPEPGPRVLHVCAELYPLLKTGGLADVTGALPAALQRVGCQARVLLPGFPAVLAGLAGASEVARLRVPWSTVWGEPAEARLLFGWLRDTEGPGGSEAEGSAPVGLYVIDAPFLYDRPGNPYADARQQPYGDNHRRFALLGWVAAQLAQGLDSLWRAEVLHSHDWHAGLASAYLAAARQQRGQAIAASVFTIHNLAYQGLFAPHHLAETALPVSFFNAEGLEFFGQISYLKAGLVYSDRITTVSPTYAREIQTPEQGHGLDGLLRARAGDVRGILNGVDGRVWNPAA